MNKETEKCIEELKEVVMDLHRSAGNLDSIIQAIESEKDSSEEYVKIMIASQCNWRHGLRKNELDKKEDIIWEQMIATFKKDES